MRLTDYVEARLKDGATMYDALVGAVALSHERQAARALAQLHELARWEAAYQLDRENGHISRWSWWRGIFGDPR